MMAWIIAVITVIYFIILDKVSRKQEKSRDSHSNNE